MAKKNFQREVELKIDYGNRVAPHSETLEDTVLGQILINSEAISDVMNLYFCLVSVVVLIQSYHIII